MNARDEILARIRDGLRDAEPPPAQGPSSTAAPGDLESHAERVSAFCRHLTAAEGRVRMVADEEQAAAALREIVEKAGAELAFALVQITASEPPLAVVEKATAAAAATT